MITGGAGADLIKGGRGDDNILGGSGANTIIGGGGRQFPADWWRDQLAEGGGNGNNTIVDLGGYAGAGTSTLTAGTGNDTITGFGGDTVSGGNSAAGSTGHSILNRGDLSDIELHSAASTYNVLNSGSTGDSNGNNLVGGAGADTLNGGNGHDTLTAGSGDQLLMAGSGAHQSLIGGAGNDVLKDLYSGGTDTLTAGPAPARRPCMANRAIRSTAQQVQPATTCSGFSRAAVQVHLSPEVPATIPSISRRM